MPLSAYIVMAYIHSHGADWVGLHRYGLYSYGLSSYGPNWVGPRHLAQEASAGELVYVINLEQQIAIQSLATRFEPLIPNLLLLYPVTPNSTVTF